ncbi:MAG: gluconeogenesis factor YvcK family protein, partial [Acidimicrobiales bacterium]
LRKCLVALAEPRSTWAEAFEYRFAGGDLAGHALGNLLIAGLAAATGDFIGALTEAGRLVGATGTVLPATLEPVRLAGSAAGGAVVGQQALSRAGAIAGVSLVPPDPEPPAAAVEAILGADQVVLGPGSLFTSVLAVLAVPALTKAVGETGARVVYVANLRPQLPETAGFDVAAHVEALDVHGVRPDVVLCDTSCIQLGSPGVPHREVRLARPGSNAHDPTRLAAALADLVG